MSVLQAIIDSSETTVEAGGLQWKVRAVDSAALTRAGVSQLLSAPTPEAIATIAQEAPPPEDETPAAKVERAKRILGTIGVERVEQRARVSMGLVCAGLVAARKLPTEEEPEPEWEEVRVVMTEAEERRQATPPRVWVGRLPSPVIETLSSAVESLSLDGGRAARRLAGFPGE